MIAGLKHVEHIIERVAFHCDVPAERLRGRRRPEAVVIARTIAIYIARKQTRLSAPDLAEAFGLRSHSSVLAAVRRGEQFAESDEQLLLSMPAGDHGRTYRDLIEQLETELLEGANL